MSDDLQMRAAGLLDKVRSLRGQIQEQIIGPTPSLEPVSLLCYAAALTSRRS